MPGVNTSSCPIICATFLSAAQLVGSSTYSGGHSAITRRSEKKNIPLEQIHYFNGICDLSYCQLNTDATWETYEKNTPVWGETYSIPFDSIATFNAPVLNVGPFGKDPHQISERLHVKSGLEEMPELLHLLINYVKTSIAQEAN